MMDDKPSEKDLYLLLVDIRDALKLMASIMERREQRELGEDDAET